MSAYYNEIDPHAAAWLRELIARDLIAPGDVDERSIEDIKPNELRRYTQCHFFAGIGGWAYAIDLAGWPRDRPVWTGSCPCQPFSAAGKGAGFEDERHLWPAWQHLIAQCGPAEIFGEQVASKDAEPWIDLVHADLEGMGYAFGCVPFPAAGVGAPHIRDRNYWVAYTEGGRWAGQHIRAAGGLPQDGNAKDRGAGRPCPTNGHWRAADWLGCRDGKWRPVEARPQPLVDGLPISLGRVRDRCIVEIEEEVTAYAKDRETGAAQELRNLCFALGEEAQRLGPAGGFGDIQAPQVLLSFVCQLAAQGWGIAKGLPLRRQEMSGGGLRMLWDHEEAARASCGRGLEEQRPREFADALHFLSPVLARHAQAAWDQAIKAHAEIGFPLGTGHEARVGRLRGYGNAIVPQAAAEFIRAYVETRQGEMRIAA